MIRASIKLAAALTLLSVFVAVVQNLAVIPALAVVGLAAVGVKIASA